MCASAAASSPRNTESTVLYSVVAQNLETFLARQEERERGIPKFVEGEFRSYLKCGVLACGFLRLKCENCGQEKWQPFSCKGRAVCSSCCGRRMADTAAHLTDHVFPRVPVRQWVLALPHALRYRLAYDSKLVTAVLDVFVRAVFGFLRRQARAYGIEPAQCGAVTFIQRFSDNLSVNPHFHTIAFDGVYASGRRAEPQFFPLRAPDDSEVAALAAELAQRISDLLKRRGLDLRDADTDECDPLARDQPWLAGIYAASVSGRVADRPDAGRRVFLGGDQIDPGTLDAAYSPRCANVAGFSLHANVSIPAGDRDRLECLFRYAARPPLATERLEKLPMDD